MYQLQILNLVQNSMKIAIILSSPILLSLLLIGLLINIVQVSTQINEQTLSFIPKILVIFFSGFFFGSWMLKYILDYIVYIFHNIPVMIQ
ncbi:flagellar biosynthetic protein FliQ [Buchnera aphidicola]|uniref:flagellar biosynthetic protein FliQ n=1 Tax=Buchnera aphidicola TaxID=9 RepID=UPI0031B73213